MEELTQEQRRYLAAVEERTQLREQAWNAYKNNLECEERRYQHELENISRHFRRQTGTGDGPEEALAPLCRYCGQSIMQASPGRWLSVGNAMAHCPHSTRIRHSPA